MLNLYETYYKLDGDPFRLTPDHRFSIPHRSYANAKSYLEYALFQGEGFVMVTGDPGTGKTTLVHDILSGFDKSRIRVATLNSTQLDTRDLLHMVAILFGLNIQEVSKPALLQSLERYLTQQIQRGHRSVLIVDEAQGLSGPALEELRLLANLQHGNRAVLQVALVGQKQLHDVIGTPDMEHLRQRVIASTTLEPLSFDETVNYVEHRLCQVGWEGNPTISGEALQLVYRFSGGVPRRINLICNRLFLYGGLESKHALDGTDTRTVIEELQQEGLISAEIRVDDEEQDILVQGEAVNASGYNLPRADMLAGRSLPREDGPKHEDVIPFQPTAAVQNLDKWQADIRAASDRLDGDAVAEPWEEEHRNEDGDAGPGVDELYEDLKAEPSETRPPRKKWVWATAYSLLAVFISAAIFIRSEGLEETLDRVSGVINHYTTLARTKSENGGVIQRGTAENRARRDAQETTEVALPVPSGENVSDVPLAPEAQAAAPVQDETGSKQSDPVVELAGIITAKPEPGSQQGAGLSAEVPGPVAEQPEAVSADQVAKQPEALAAGPEAVADTQSEVLTVASDSGRASFEAEYTRLRDQAGQRLARLEETKTTPAKKSAQGASSSATKARSEGAPEGARRESSGSPQHLAKVTTPDRPAVQPEKTVYSPDQLKSSLLEGRWSSQGKPAAHLTSEITFCQDKGQIIKCWSVPQYIQQADGAALQKVETTLQDFSTPGSFRLVFRTLVKGPGAGGERGPDTTAATMDEQWHITEHEMVCRFSELKAVTCRDMKGNTLHYQRLPSG